MRDEGGWQSSGCLRVSVFKMGHLPPPRSRLLLSRDPGYSRRRRARLLALGSWLVAQPDPSALLARSMRIQHARANRGSVCALVVGGDVERPDQQRARFEVGLSAGECLSRGGRAREARGSLALRRWCSIMLDALRLENEVPRRCRRKEPASSSRAFASDAVAARSLARSFAPATSRALDRPNKSDLLNQQQQQQRHTLLRRAARSHEEDVR